MYQDYDRAANQVINHLTKRHCASSIIYMNKRCFRLFKEYMIEKNIEYSYMPSEPHGEGDIAVELWKKLEPGEK